MLSLRLMKTGDAVLLKDSSYERMDAASISEMLRCSAEHSSSGRFFELLAVMLNGECIGFMNLFADSDAEISCGPEIKPRYRRQGYAFHAETIALDYARQKGFTLASAQVRSENIASIALHKKLGFEIIGESVSTRGYPVFAFEKKL